MTVIQSDRLKLDNALTNTRLTLLLLSGSDATAAQVVHDRAEEIRESWQRVFWIQDLGRLTPDELAAWFATGGRYAVSARKTRAVVERKALQSLLLVSGKPSTILIAKALNLGDL